MSCHACVQTVAEVLALRSGTFSSIQEALNTNIQKALSEQTKQKRCSQKSVDTNISPLLSEEMPVPPAYTPGRAALLKETSQSSMASSPEADLPAPTWLLRAGRKWGQAASQRARATYFFCIVANFHTTALVLQVFGDFQDTKFQEMPSVFPTICYDPKSPEFCFTTYPRRPATWLSPQACLVSCAVIPHKQLLSLHPPAPSLLGIFPCPQKPYETALPNVSACTPANAGIL